MDKKTTQRPILNVLKAVAGDPDTFGSFLRHLTADDLDHAWLLAFELAAADDVACNSSAELLAGWCTRHLLTALA